MSLANGDGISVQNPLGCVEVFTFHAVHREQSAPNFFQKLESSYIPAL